MAAKEEEMTCRACDAKVSTYLGSESTYYTWIILALVCFIFRWWSFILLPFVFPLARALVVRCTRCDTKLVSYNPFGLPNLQDEVVTWKCGQCAIVLSRTYVYTLVAVLTLLIVTFWVLTAPAEVHVIRSAASWSEYLQDCGADVVLKNPIRANLAFQTKYEAREVSWDGYLVKLAQNQGAWWTGGHAATLLVKMQPSESEVHADIILSFDDDELQEFSTALSTLERGSHFAFNGTLVTMGNEHRLHHMHGHSLHPLEGKMTIPEHVHLVNQRYNLNTSMPPVAPVAVVSVTDKPPERAPHTDVHSYGQDGEQTESHD
jgi:hypothetical protein